MRLDLAANEDLQVRLQRWPGFLLGLPLGLIVGVIWLITSDLIPKVIEGTTFGHGVGLRAAIYGFIIIGLLWGLLLHTGAGITWAVGVGLGVGLVTGGVAGVGAALGWGLDWEFGERAFVRRQDLLPQGVLGGTVTAVTWTVIVGLMTLLGSILASLFGALVLRRPLAAVASVLLEVARTLAPDGVQNRAGRGRRVGGKRQLPAKFQPYRGGPRNTRSR